MFEPKTTPTTFAEKFCARHNLVLEKYEEVAFKRALYPAARILRPLLMLKAGYLTADHEFIRGVGRLTRLGSFQSNVDDYLYHPRNRGFLRRGLKLRVSVSRLNRLVHDAFSESQT